MDAGLEHSRSNLVFKIRNDFIFEMVYFLFTLWTNLYDVTKWGKMAELNSKI